MATEVACGIMFIDNNNFLIGKRPSLKEDSGYWEFPGGKREKDENIYSCLKREWIEELNLKINIEKEVFSYKYKHYVCRFFVGKIVNINSIIIKEHDEIKFVNKDTIKNYKLISGDEKVIDFI